MGPSRVRFVQRTRYNIKYTFYKRITERMCDLNTGAG